MLGTQRCRAHLCGLPLRVTVAWRPRCLLGRRKGKWNCWSIPGRQTVGTAVVVNSAEKPQYTVKEGDSLHLIAKNFGISTKDLKEANSALPNHAGKKSIRKGSRTLHKSDIIYPGDVLTLPASDPKESTTVGKEEKPAETDVGRTPSIAVPASPTQPSLSIKDALAQGWVAYVSAGAVFALAWFLYVAKKKGGFSNTEDNVGDKLLISGSEGGEEERDKPQLSEALEAVSSSALLSNDSPSLPSIEALEDGNEGRVELGDDGPETENGTSSNGLVEENWTPAEDVEEGAESTAIPNWMDGASEASDADGEQEALSASELAKVEDSKDTSFIHNGQLEVVDRLFSTVDGLALGNTDDDSTKLEVVGVVEELEASHKTLTESQVLMTIWGSWSVAYTSDSFVTSVIRFIETMPLMNVQGIRLEVNGANKATDSKLLLASPVLSTGPDTPDLFPVRTSSRAAIRFSHTNGVPETFLPQILSTLDLQDLEIPSSVSMLGREVDLTVLHPLFTPVRDRMNAGLESAHSVVSSMERFLPQRLAGIAQNRADKWLRITYLAGDVLVCRDEADEIYVFRKEMDGLGEDVNGIDDLEEQDREEEEAFVLDGAER